MNENNASPTQLPPAAARLYRSLLNTLANERPLLLALGLTSDEADQIVERIDALDEALRPHLATGH